MLPWMIIRLLLSVISMYKTAIKSMVLENCFNRRDCSSNIAILDEESAINSTGPYVISAILTNNLDCVHTLLQCKKQLLW